MKQAFVNTTKLPKLLAGTTVRPLKVYFNDPKPINVLDDTIVALHTLVPYLLRGKHRNQRTRLFVCGNQRDGRV
jgi:hypothetical protein